MLRRPDVFHAAIAGAPVTDWRLYDTHYTERYLGHPDKRPEVYDRNSLIDDAPNLARPLLIIHGLADELGGAVGDALVARVRKGLLEDGVAVLGRSFVGPSTPDGDDGTSRLWLKLALLHPHPDVRDYEPLLDIVAARARVELRPVVADADRMLVRTP